MEITAFSQGTLIYAAAMKYVEEKYGKGSVSQIKTNTVILVGSAQPIDDFRDFMASRGSNTKIESKVDKNDLVGTLIGLNPGTVDPDPETLNNPKRNTLTHHSGYTRGDDKEKAKIEKEEKTVFQEIRDMIGTGLEFVNYKNYKPYPKKGVEGLKDTKETLKGWHKSISDKLQPKKEEKKNEEK